MPSSPQPYSIAHCISADARMKKGFADTLSNKVPQLREKCRSTTLQPGQILPFWDEHGDRYIYNLVTKEKFSDKPTIENLSKALTTMKSHATTYGVHSIAMPKIGCGLDQMNWQDVLRLLKDQFAYSSIRVIVYTLEEYGAHALSTDGDQEFYAEDEVERYSEEFHLNEKELETDFTSDAKSCQPTCNEQFRIFRPKEQNNHLIEQYLQHQPKSLVDYIKEFDFQYSDIHDEELTQLIDLLIDALRRLLATQIRCWQNTTAVPCYLKA